MIAEDFGPVYTRPVSTRGQETREGAASAVRHRHYDWRLSEQRKSLNPLALRQSYVFCGTRSLSTPHSPSLRTVPPSRRAEHGIVDRPRTGNTTRAFPVGYFAATVARPAAARVANGRVPG